MVNESGYVPTFGGINDGLLIESEHVAASDASVLIPPLPHVSNYLKRKKRDVFSICAEKNLEGGKVLREPLQ